MWFTMLTTVTEAAGSMLTLHVQVCCVTAALQDSQSARSAKSDNLQQLEAVQHKYFTLSRSLTSSEHDAHVMYPGHDCGFDITQTFTPRWLTPKCWQDIDKVWSCANKTFPLTLNCGRWCHAGFSCPLSDYQSRPTARTGNNLRLSNMGTSPSAFRWHLLSMMHMSCILLMISCCSLTLQKCQSDLVSIPGLCLPSSTTASTSLLAFSAFRICRRCIGQHTHWHPNGWQDMTQFRKFGHVQTKHCFFPSKPLNCDRWCHSKWQWFCGIQLSTIRLSAKTARTGSNLKLSNMGTSPFTFRWHLLSMMHMSCILLMISCYWPTLQKLQSGLVSVPRFWLQSSTTASACLLDSSVARICRWWIRHLMSRIWNGLSLLMVLISQSTGMWHLS